MTPPAEQLSFAQRMALDAAYHGDNTDWVRANTISSLIKRGLIRWIDNCNAYQNGRGGYITTPKGTKLAARLEGQPDSGGTKYAGDRCI